MPKLEEVDERVRWTKICSVKQLVQIFMDNLYEMAAKLQVETDRKKAEQDALELLLLFKFLAAKTQVLGRLNHEVESAFVNIKRLIAKSNPILQRRCYLGTFRDYERCGESFTEDEVATLIGHIMSLKPEPTTTAEPGLYPEDSSLPPQGAYGGLPHLTNDFIGQLGQKIDRAGRGQ